MKYMSKRDLEDVDILIGPKEWSDDKKLLIPILGEKDENLERVSANAFLHAIALLEDASDVTKYTGEILISLSCELFLKAIIFRTKGEISHGHDLHQLYFTLEEKEQNYLVEAYIKRRIPPDEEISGTAIDEIIDSFEKDLSTNALSFEILRYKHEYSTIFYTPVFLLSFANDLRTLANTLGFYG